jgi:hypothetical protein
MVGGIILIVIGLIMMIAGPTTGIIVSRRDDTGRRHSAKVVGNSAAGIGVLIMIYGIYVAATSVA